MTNRHAVIASLLLIVSGCAAAPVGDAQPGERPSLETDEAGLWQMVERDEFRLQTSAEVIRDQELQSYLDGVLCRVAPDYCGDIRIYVIPSYGFNAFMMPNGTMGVFTGLLLRLENEAQLAAILGHEVAHYTRRHSLQAWRAWRAKAGTWQTVASIVSAGAGVAAANANAAAASGQYGRAIEQAELARSIANVGSAVLTTLEYYAVFSQLAYSRQNESESDALGLKMMHAGGYDPATAAEAWQVLETEEALDDGYVPAFLRTHPPPGDRKARIAAQSADLEPDQTHALARNGAAYRERIAPFRHAWLRYARSGLSPTFEAALLERQRQIGVPAGLLSFHEADMYRKRGGEGDDERALAAFRKALEGPGCPAEAHREYGLALWDAGLRQSARQAFEDYLDADPDAVDHAMIESYIEELR